MTLRRPGTAWGLLILSILLLGPTPLLADVNWPLGAVLVMGAVVVLTAGCGALVAARRLDHPVGWILLGIALTLAAGLLATLYASRSLVGTADTPAWGLAAAWLQTWLWFPLIALLALLLLLFPTGGLPGPRWRLAVWVAVTSTVLGAVLAAVEPGPMETFPQHDNPLGLAFLADVPVWALVFPLVLAGIPAVLASGVSVILRFRRSRGVERQQIKWLAFAVGAAVLLTLSNPALVLASRYDVMLPGTDLSLLFLLPMMGLALLPVAIGLAVLRYGLFEIDRIVSRTVSYAVVVAVLAAMYAGIVVGLSRLVPAAGTSDLTVAGSTLVVAALFGPVRRRVKGVVDHRFNRGRYDAAQAADTFAARLRAEVDLDTITTDLIGVVTRTLAPASASLWLRGESAVDRPR